jgi:23S rRNA pseudouridine1911/1915/1917 synthase
MSNPPVKNSTSRSWKIPPELIGKTLSAALKALNVELSWNDAKRLIERRHVALNEVLCLDEARRMVADDELELFTNPLPPPPNDKDVRTSYMDDDVLVLEKPSGMISLRHVAQLSMPTAERRTQPTLDEVALRIIGERIRTSRDMASIPPKHRRRFIRAVHRLDRETSGLVVFARSVEAEIDLFSKFAHHTIERIYLTVVLGHPKAQTIESFLIRDRGDGLRGRTSNTSEGKRAVTHIRPIERLGDYSLVECKLETGRTHQIRIHLTELGYPVCGDTMYRSAFNKPPVEDQSGAKRLALHAHRLAFEHPQTGRLMTFEAPLPPDMQTLVDSLRSRSAAPKSNTKRSS